MKKFPILAKLKSLRTDVDSLSDSLWKKYGENFKGDANTLVDNGCTYCNGATNTPSNVGNGILLVFRASSTLLMQMYCPYNGSTYYRRITSNNGSTWTNWA